MQVKKVLIASGGTGGHIYPAMAVAEALREAGHEVVLLFSGTRSAEKYAQAEWAGPILTSGARPLRNVPMFFVALWRCLKIMKREHPDVLFATGGYTCAAPVLAARFCKIPVVFHEANAIPGKAIVWFAKHFQIKAVDVSFAESATLLPGVNTAYTGFPLRKSIMTEPHVAHDSETFTILITGGSQGARAVNQLAKAAICAIVGKGAHDLRVMHQCGPADVAALTQAYAEAGVVAEVAAFFTDMPQRYARADMVIARAGASTCFELARCGVPAVLIPLPSAVGDHQTLNAKALVHSGGALLCPQATTTPQTLIDIILQLRSDPPLRQSMSAALRAIDYPNATDKIIEGLLS